MKIGMKIYYEKSSGNIILNIGECSGNYTETTKEQDFASYQILAARVPESVGLIELQYGQADQIFQNATGYRVNPETEELEFSYDPIVMDPPTPPVYQKPLTEQIADLSAELSSTQLALTENYEELQATRQEAAEAQLALTELYELVLAGQSTGGGEKDNG